MNEMKTNKFSEYFGSQRDIIYYIDWQQLILGIIVWVLDWTRSWYLIDLNWVLYHITSNSGFFPLCILTK